jgi:hypothetical protein
VTEPTPPPAKPASRGPLLFLAALAIAAVVLGTIDLSSEPTELTPAELRAVLEEKRAPQGPIPGTLHEYRVEFQPGRLRVADARGDWMWIALEGERATDIVFGLDLPQGDVAATPEGLRIALDATRAQTVPRDPSKVRVATPSGVEERALKGSVHDDVAKRVFDGSERRPLREVLAGVSQPR